MAESVQQYYDLLTEAYLDRRNDEDAKCKNFRIAVEQFFKFYVCPDEPETATLFDRQKCWHEKTGDWPLNRFISSVRVDLNEISHGLKHVKSKEALDYYYKACVTIVYRISGEEPDDRTKAAYGLFDNAYLGELNEQQRDAVLDGKRIIYVNAGPGSGKTRLLVYKVIDLMAKEGSDAKIVALSYTRTSAKSLGDRLQEASDRLNLVRPTIPYSGTIHSYCLNCMKEYRSRNGGRFDYSIADDSEIDEIVEDIFYGLDGAYEREVIKQVVLKPETECDASLREAIAERKDIYNRITVGQILSLYYRELESNEDFVKWCGERVNRLLVDEAQDLTIENYQIFDLLLRKLPELKIFLVGDPRQNIFSFLGGSYKNLDEFLKAYEGEVSMRYLSYSYRCPQKVLDFTNTMDFTDCDNVALTSLSKEEGTIRVQGYEDEYEEAKYTVGYIKERGDFGKIAILSPRLRPLSKIVDELNKADISFTVKGGSNAIKPHIQAFNCMNRYVESKGKAIGAANNLCEKIEKPKCRTLKEFGQTEVGAQLNTLSLTYNNGNMPYIELARKFVGLCRKYLPFGDKVEQDEDFRKLYALVIKQSAAPADFSRLFKTCRRQFESSEVDFKSTGHTPESVTISTVHSAKGLEWPCVILPCMSENYFPNKKLQDSVDPEERLDGLNTDRKLLFVGVTRTMKDLVVSYPAMIADTRTQTKASSLLGALALL